MLERCFRDIVDGFYIDVGAWDPRHDSVTHHFYEKGWSGINIEPSAQAFEALCSARPRDINLKVALGEIEDGVHQFTDFRGGGISTMRSLPQEYLANLDARGFTPRTAEVPVTTLAKVCGEHVPDDRTIDFLKIDVEGWEEAVLLGHDWKRWRPRVLVVESITPTSFDEATGRDIYEDLSADWEPIVLDNGYRFALNDGVNRFYVRRESSELLESLRVPVNTLDQAVHYRDHERIVLLREAREHVTRMDAQAQEQIGRIVELEEALARVTAELESRTRRVDELESSTSWRISAPLRVLGQLRHANREGANDRTGHDGVNVIGHFRDTSGLTEATRSTARCVEAGGLGISTLDVGPASEQGDDLEPTWRDHSLPYDVTVVHDNVAHAADQATLYARGRASGGVVGFWYWELADVPEEFLPHFELVDEVWVPSTFVHDALRPCTDKPVTIVPPSLDFRAPNGASRAAFGLPEDRFLFLTMASVYSVLERKNPMGVVHAFEEAFPGREDVGLVVKITDLHLRPDVAAGFEDAADRLAIYLLNDRLSRQQTVNLFAVTDAYVSLHRSEGFGLPIAEAMALGKPVVATGYSGNVDFTSTESAYVVPYDLVELPETYSVYPGGFQWAEPDGQAAAALMRSVVDDSEGRSRVAAAGCAAVRALCDPATGGSVSRDRIAARTGKAPGRA